MSLSSKQWLKCNPQTSLSAKEAAHTSQITVHSALYGDSNAIRLPFLIDMTSHHPWGRSQERTAGKWNWLCQRFWCSCFYCACLSSKWMQKSPRTEGNRARLIFSTGKKKEGLNHVCLMLSTSLFPQYSHYISVFWIKGLGCVCNDAWTTL